MPCSPLHSRCTRRSRTTRSATTPTPSTPPPRASEPPRPSGHHAVVTSVPAARLGPPPTRADRRWAWALFAVFVVHNGEEAATMSAFLQQGAGGLGIGPGALPVWFVAVGLV